ncbi:MFS general substrate transporter [Wolfiporia cocos MD-104 SS10]|uniref:MFS general substrate transporter n=1 Tax=Wolfiporia cocos (strain MD-104) TaxID=742152 RepID=A0A2H3JD38_WOLCO|nr:MFS general substrate transporter [Wolfiporia cocos MD-104 SS10]
MSGNDSGSIETKGIKAADVKEEPITPSEQVDKDNELLSADLRPQAERQLVRMLDLRLMPTIIVIFLMNYIDRSAVTSARLQGLTQDLHLTQIQYSTVLAVLMASYVPAEIPSNMVTRSYTGILICRIFIGLPEELAFRSAVIYGGLLISNAFGNGAISVFIGILAIFILPDYVRLAEDAGEADEDAANESAFVGLKLALKDPKVLVFSLMNCSQLLGLGFINFFPTSSLRPCDGDSSSRAYRPPWILSTIVCAANAWSADRTGERFFHHCWTWWGVIVAYIIGVSTMSFGGRYFAMFLMATGYSGFAMTAVWVANAVPRPPAKRSAAIGFVNAIGNIGNLISSYTWRTQWSPSYHPSMFIGIAALSFSTVLAFVIRCMLVYENKRLACDELEDLKGARRERIEEAARLEGLTFEEALERKRGFRYLY